MYSATFPAGELPPVKGFWSLTVYNKHHIFEVNDLNRYSIGTKNKSLTFGEDGSLTIYVSAESPGTDKESNWIPAPAESFSLYIRCYWGDDAVLDGTWVPPPVHKAG